MERVGNHKWTAGRPVRPDRDGALCLRSQRSHGTQDHSVRGFVIPVLSKQKRCFVHFNRIQASNAETLEARGDTDLIVLIVIRGASSESFLDLHISVV